MPDPKNIADLRKSYESDELIESEAAADPLAQFQRWLQQALNAQLPEPNAMTLATVGIDGRPSTRIVLVKGVDARGLVFYTNYDSRKGQELAAHPQAALQFHWVELERVVRIEGTVVRVDTAASDAYYRSRPLGSRIGAWASPQSRVIASREALEAAADAAAVTHGDDPARPPHWGGFRLSPDRWEFWQGRKNRLHDRLRYRLNESVETPGADADAAPDGHGRDAWIRERLAP